MQKSHVVSGTDKPYRQRLTTYENMHIKDKGGKGPWIPKRRDGGARGMDRWSLEVIRWVREPREIVDIQNTLSKI